MKKANVLLVMSLLISIGIAFYACKKSDSPQLLKSSSSLVSEMAKDQDVHIYYTIVKIQANRLAKATNTKPGQPQMSKEEISDVVKNNVSTELTTFISKQAVKIWKTYNLSLYTEGDVINILDSTFSRIEKDKGLINKGIQIKPKGANLRVNGVPMDPIGTGSCTDWYWVTIDNNTGATVASQYLFSECTGQAGAGGGSMSFTVNFDPTPGVDCDKKYASDQNTCENALKFRMAVTYLVAAAILAVAWDTAIPVPPNMAIGFAGALVNGTYDYNVCMSKARAAYDDCLEQAKNLPH